MLWHRVLYFLIPMFGAIGILSRWCNIMRSNFPYRTFSVLCLCYSIQCWMSELNRLHVGKVSSLRLSLCSSQFLSWSPTWQVWTHLPHLPFCVKDTSAEAGFQDGARHLFEFTVVRTVIMSYVARIRLSVQSLHFTYFNAENTQRISARNLIQRCYGWLQVCFFKKPLCLLSSCTFSYGDTTQTSFKRFDRKGQDSCWTKI